MTRKLVILDGDQTGQELLVEALRVLDPEVTGFDVEFLHYDLSLENRRKTQNKVVYEAAEAIREYHVGLKAATITPEAKNDVGSPNAILREAMDAEIILRTGPIGKERRVLWPSLALMGSLSQLGTATVISHKQHCQLQ